MSWEAVKWAMDDAPMLRTEKGKPDSTSRHVLQVLAEHASATGRNAHPSEVRIMYRTGYERTTVQRAIRRLEKAALIIDDGWCGGCRNWRLDMSLKRPDTDYAETEAAVQSARDAGAARVRRHRRSAVTDSEYVTDGGVTDSESVRNAPEVRYVTHSDPPEPPLPPKPEPTRKRAPYPSDPQDTAAHGSLRSPRLPSKDEDDHLPAEDPLPAVRTATIPGDDRDLADVVNIEDRKLAKESHMNGCQACQSGRWQCAEGRALTLAATGLWDAVPADRKRSAGLL